MKKALWLLALVLTAATGAAVEIPDGLKTNIQMGEFKDNAYIRLKTLVVRDWWNSETPGENTLIGAAFDSRDPKDDGEAPEKVVFSYGIWDTKKKDYVTDLKAFSVDGILPFTIKWDMRGKDGEIVPDGIYRVVMNIAGERYGDLLDGGAFPLYVTAGGPRARDDSISSRVGVLEYDGAPEIKFTTDNVNAVAVVDYDDDDNVLGRWERVLPAGVHRFKSDLLDDDAKPFAPGRYATGVTVSNPFGDDLEFKFRYAIQKPEPLEVSVKFDAPASVTVDDKTKIPYVITLSRPADLTVEHLSAGGDVNLIGKSRPGLPAVRYDKGTYHQDWLLVDRARNARYKSGNHTIRVTAATLAETKTAETRTIALKEKPKPKPKPAPQPQARQAGGKRGQLNLRLSLEPDHIVIGRRTLLTIRYGMDYHGIISLKIVDHRGRTVRTLIDDFNKSTDKGSYKMELDVRNFEYGTYRVVLTGKNIYDESSVSEVLSIGWQ